MNQSQELVKVVDDAPVGLVDNDGALIHNSVPILMALRNMLVECRGQFVKFNLRRNGGADVRPEMFVAEGIVVLGGSVLAQYVAMFCRECDRLSRSCTSHHNGKG